MPLVGLQDTYKLTLKGRLDNQDVSNVFHYHRSSASGTAVALANAFVTTVLPDILSIVSSAVLYTTVDAVNIENADDAASILVGAVGLRDASFVSSFASWGFRLFPSIASIQVGSKRFAGVSETDITEGVATGLQIARLAITSTRLQNAFNSVFVTYTPAIYSDREVLGIPFRRVATVASCAYNWMTTQNSRKTGRGS